MAANTRTVTRYHRVRASVHVVSTVCRHAGAGIAAGWSWFATTGQLGADPEQERSRHTGARI
jgi:hypothetical protein